MVNLLDVLYVVLIIFLIVLTIAAGFIAYYLVQTLKSAQRVVDDVAATTSAVRSFQNTLKFGILNILGYFFGPKDH